MYGVIFHIFKDLIVTKLGEEKWKELLAAVGIENDFVDNQNYKDENMFALVEAAAKMLNVPEPELLEAVGYWAPMFFKNGPFAKLFDMIGHKSLGEILQNVNSLHGHIKVSFFPDIQKPNIRVTQMKENSFYVHYIPGNEQRAVKLNGFFTGFVKGLGEMHLNLKHLVVKQKRFIAKDGEDVFYVRWSKSSESLYDDHSNNINSPNLATGIPGKTLGIIFPFHIVVNKRFEVVQFGRSIAKLLPSFAKGNLLSSHFTIVAPKLASFDSFKNLIKIAKTDPITLEFKTNNFRGQNNPASQPLHLKLKGQVVGLEKDSMILFVCSPLVKTAELAQTIGLELSDFAIHDPTKDLLFMNEFTDIMKPLIATMNREEAKAGCPFIQSSPTTSPQLQSHENNTNHQLPTVLTKASLANMNFHTASPPKKPSTMQLHQLIRNGTTTPTTSSLPSSSNSSPTGSSSNISYYGNAKLDALGEHGGNLLNKLFGSSCSSLIDANKEKSLYNASFDLDSSDTVPTMTGKQVFDGSINAGRINNGFKELLLEDGWSNYDFMKALLENYTMANNSEQVFGAVIQFYNKYDKIDQFLTSCIQDEIYNPKFASDPNGVFRSHSVPSTMISVYMKSYGRKYLSGIINPLLEHVKARAHNLTKNLEHTNSVLSISNTLIGQTDKNKINRNSGPSASYKKIEQNEIELVKECTQKFINNLIRSTEYVPLPIRRLLRLIAREAAKQYPEFHINLITSLFFLKFVCPGILIPDEVSTGPIYVRTADVQRYLVMISKVVQNLANGVEFDGSKEEHMMVFNGFVRDGNHGEDIVGFVLGLMRVDETKEVKKEGGDASVEVIRDAVVKNMDKLWKTAMEKREVGVALQRFCSISMSTVSSNC